jgi:hypothetical protein
MDTIHCFKYLGEKNEVRDGFGDYIYCRGRSITLTVEWRLECDIDYAFTRGNRWDANICNICSSIIHILSYQLVNFALNFTVSHNSNN